MGVAVDLEYTTALYTIKEPDVTVFLEIDDEDLRQKRLRERECITAGDRIVNQFNIRERILFEYSSFSQDLVKIDNSHRVIDDVVKDIRAWL
jgi:thymidylate kinase